MFTEPTPSPLETSLQCLAARVALQFPKACRRCDTTHDLHAWWTLAYVGLQSFTDEVLELRNCACGSTLAISVAGGEP